MKPGRVRSDRVGMAKKPTKAAKVQTRVLELLTGIQSKRINAVDLPREDLVRVVDHMVWGGIARAEAAQVLGISDAEVEDLIEAAREERAIGDPEVEACRIAGDVWATAVRSAERVRAACRSGEVPPQAKAAAEVDSARLLFEAVKLLQSMGALPDAARWRNGTAPDEWFDESRFAG